MLNNNNQNTEINECTSRAACTVSPTVAALESLAVLFLKHLSHYLLELSGLGAANRRIQTEIINIFASLTAVNEFSNDQLYNIIVNEYFILEEVKKTYSDLTKEKGIAAKPLPPIENFTAETTQAQAISLGEKILLTDEKITRKNNLLAILLITLQSVSLNFIKYANFKEFDDILYTNILTAVNMLNSDTLTENELKENITGIAQQDFELQVKLSRNFLKIFGPVERVEVSHSTRPGKTILVSGNNFSSLYKILLETRDKNIDVYSHSNLLIANALGKFRQFEHFKGHYGSKTENCILDFATFPGAILMTQNFRSNTEYLYRGRIYSNDYIVPKGVTKITGEDFTPLIDCSLEAKGFSKGRIKNSTPLGYNTAEVEEKFDEIINGLNSGQISRLYIIGTDALSETESAYYEKLLKCLKDDEFALSFSYESKRTNVFTVNVGNFIPLMSGLLAGFFEKCGIKNDKITFFFTTCDVITISLIIMLSSKGCQNVYMSQCLPTAVNPATFSTLIAEYGIHTTTSPKNDLAAVRNE